ncbi:hypothetical protein BB561_005640 [Smittium simulii]|uniref:OPT family small oligopeptide transporter n=1 Tax=Smittium simulii TaxID=133385 RepID=A0A2T9Y9A4_9FUNG|nr:hypothetical protein BB561_005640 [Smittium simulii]
MNYNNETSDSKSEKSFIYDDDASFIGYENENEDDGTHSIVRAIVSNEDDPSLPVLTFRFWVIGTFFLVVITIVNTIAQLSSSRFTFSLIFAQLFVYPIGNLMAKILPNKQFNLGRYSFSLNPGPFNIKEHSALAIYIGLSFGISDATTLYVQGSILYNSGWSVPVSLLLLIFPSLSGVGLQALIGEYLIKSPDMTFPAILVSITLLKSLHNRKNIGSSTGITGVKFVLIVALFSAIYHFIPKIFMQILQYLSILCYIFPNNKLVHQLTSGNAGLGMGSISLDWNVITRFGMAPLIMPLWSATNAFIGFVLTAWIITPLLYYTNTLNFAYFPINSSNIYDITGRVYRVDLVIAQDNRLDIERYLSYSPLKLNVSVFLAYFFSFAGIVSLVVHFGLNYTGHLMRYMQNVIIESKKAVGGFSDIHNRLMRQYKTIPTWWSYTLVVICLTCSLIGSEMASGEINWYLFMFSASLGVALFFPIAIVFAISTLRADPSILIQAFIGYLYPGRPVGNFAARSFGNMVLGQMLQSSENMKIGHYMKLPPRGVFLIQIVGTTICILTSLTTIKILEYKVSDLCQRTSQDWNCFSMNTMYSASSIWGLFGPSELFNTGREYAPLWISIAVGLISPVIIFALSKKYPGTILSYIHIPIIFNVAASYPPNTSSALVSSFILSMIFNYYLYRYKHSWWTRYNYLLNIGVDLGTVITVMIIGLLGKNIQPIKWEGNSQFGGCKLAIIPHKLPGS